MKLYKVDIPKIKLESFQENEMIFFIQIANLLNEINILHKLLIFSNKSAKTDVETRAQNSQSFFILVLLAGKLWEGWQLLQSKFFSSKLSKEYETLLGSDGKECLKKLKIYFSRENLIKKIRNDYAFHYSSEGIKEQIDNALSDETFEIYVSETHANCFYYMANVLTSSAILNDIDPSDSWKALDKLFKEILTNSKWYLGFLSECLLAIARKYEILDFKKIEIPDPPSVNTVHLPWFVKYLS